MKNSHLVLYYKLAKILKRVHLFKYINNITIKYRIFLNRNEITSGFGDHISWFTMLWNYIIDNIRVDKFLNRKNVKELGRNLTFVGKTTHVDSPCVSAVCVSYHIPAVCS